MILGVEKHFRSNSRVQKQSMFISKKEKKSKNKQCIPVQKKADGLRKKKVLLSRKSKIQISFNLKYAYCVLSRQSKND